MVDQQADIQDIKIFKSVLAQFVELDMMLNFISQPFVFCRRDLKCISAEPVEKRVDIGMIKESCKFLNEIIPVGARS